MSGIKYELQNKKRISIHSTDTYAEYLRTHAFRPTPTHAREHTRTSSYTDFFVAAPKSSQMCGYVSVRLFSALFEKLSYVYQKNRLMKELPSIYYQ